MLGLKTPMIKRTVDRLGKPFLYVGIMLLISAAIVDAGRGPRARLRDLRRLAVVGRGHRSPRWATATSCRRRSVGRVTATVLMLTGRRVAGHGRRLAGVAVPARGQGRRGGRGRRPPPRRPRPSAEAGGVRPAPSPPGPARRSSRPRSPSLRSELRCPAAAPLHDAPRPTRVPGARQRTGPGYPAKRWASTGSTTWSGTSGSNQASTVVQWNGWSMYSPVRPSSDAYSCSHAWVKRLRPVVRDSAQLRMVSMCVGHLGQVRLEPGDRGSRVRRGARCRRSVRLTAVAVEVDPGRGDRVEAHLGGDGDRTGEAVRGLVGEDVAGGVGRVGVEHEVPGERAGAHPGGRDDARGGGRRRGSPAGPGTAPASARSASATASGSRPGSTVSTARARRVASGRHATAAPARRGCGRARARRCRPTSGPIAGVVAGRPGTGRTPARPAAATPRRPPRSGRAAARVCHTPSSA